MKLVIIYEMDDWLDVVHLMDPMIVIEPLLITAAFGDVYESELEDILESVFMNDFDWRSIGVLVEVIHQALPVVKKVISIWTICEAISTLA